MVSARRLQGPIYLWKIATAILSIGMPVGSAAKFVEPAQITRIAKAETTETIVARYSAPDGSWDYLSIDPIFDRVYVARETGVLAINRSTGRVSERFVDGRATAAVVPLLGGVIALTTHPDDNLIGFFDRRTGKVIAELETDAGPDAAILNQDGTSAFVMNHEAGTISVVDIRARRIVRRIKVGGKLEAAAIDKRARLFVNVEDTSNVAVIAPLTGKVVHRIALPNCQEPTAIGAGQGHYLYSVCSSGRLVVIDARRLEVIGSIAIGKNADGIAIDAKRQRLYTSNGAGNVSVVALNDPRRPRLLTTLPSIRNGRTLALDAANQRLYVAGGPYNADEARTGHFGIVALDVSR